MSEALMISLLVVGLLLAVLMVSLVTVFDDLISELKYLRRDRADALLRPRSPPRSTPDYPYDDNA